MYLDNQPIAQLSDSAGQPSVAYIHTDHLKTLRKVSDASGKVIWSWDSDAFGNTVAETDPDGDGRVFEMNLRFAGQYFDSETGLFYNYFRYYDPKTGRYITSDPIGLGGGLNTFGYVYGNPLYWIDPYGLFQFAKKGLGSSRVRGPESKRNVGLYHEHGFYQDGSGDNIGFYRTGPGADPDYPANADRYKFYPKYYDDGLLRRAQKMVDSGEYDLIRNNCQDYADKLRDAYEMLSKENRNEDPFHPYDRHTGRKNPLP